MSLSRRHSFGTPRRETAPRYLRLSLFLCFTNCLGEEEALAAVAANRNIPNIEFLATHSNDTGLLFSNRNRIVDLSIHRSPIPGRSPRRAPRAEFPQNPSCEIRMQWLRMAHRVTSDSGKSVTAIYPGSFDPVTNGHLDLIERGANIFDRLIVAIAQNLEKDPLFAIKERVDMLEAVTYNWKNVEVDVFDGLLMDYAREKQALVVLRGIRAVSDYEYELQMAMMNRKIEPQIETVFMMPAIQYSYLSSRLVKELARLGGPVKDLVPPLVEERLRARVK